MSSATLAVLVLVAVGTIAGLVVYILLPPRSPRPPEQTLNESVVAQQWAGDLGHRPSGLAELPSHGGIDGG